MEHKQGVFGSKKVAPYALRNLGKRNLAARISKAKSRRDILAFNKTITSRGGKNKYWPVYERGTHSFFAAARGGCKRHKAAMMYYVQ